jgi:tetratricopeptide (TPR) repeat protein
VYNFFNSSPLNSDWRVLYKHVDPSQPHPTFDLHKHSALCGELKLLYVLSTRSRQNLVIFDSDKKSREPMLHHWLKSNLVEKRPFDENIRNLFLTTSSPDEWLQRGRQFLEREDYVDARLCYQRAGDDYLERLCTAHEKRKEAGRARLKSVPKSNGVYREAAELYLALGSQLPAACACYEEAGEFLLAAGHYLEQAPPCRADAARCYETAKQWREAARLFEQLEDIDSVLRCCYHIPDYHFAVAALDKARDSIPAAAWLEKEQDAVKKGAIYYHSQKQIDTMLTFVLKFSSPQEKRRFLERYLHFDKLLDIEIDEENFLGAAAIYENSLHDLLKAGDFYEEGGNLHDAVRCLLCLIRSSSCDASYIVHTVDASASAPVLSTSKSTSTAKDSSTTARAKETPRSVSDPLHLLIRAYELAARALAAAPDNPQVHAAVNIAVAATLSSTPSTPVKPPSTAFNNFFLF